MEKNENGTSYKVISYEVDGQQITLTPKNVMSCFKGSVAPTAQDVQLFIEHCRAKKLNPFTGEIWIVKNDQNQPALISISKDGANVLANRDPRYKGFKSGVIIYHPNLQGKEIFEYRTGTFHLPNEMIVGGWCTVFVDGFHDDCMENTVAFSEFDTGSAFWQSKPGVMIEKVAIVNTLRKAFPSVFSGIYGEGELDKKMDEESPQTLTVISNPQMPVQEMIPIPKTEKERPKGQKKEKLNFGVSHGDEIPESPEMPNQENQPAKVTAADPVVKPEPLPEKPPVEVRRPTRKKKVAESEAKQAVEPVEQVVQEEKVEVEQPVQNTEIQRMAQDIPEQPVVETVTTADVNVETQSEPEKVEEAEPATEVQQKQVKQTVDVEMTLDEALKTECIPGKTFAWMLDRDGKGYGKALYNNFKNKLENLMKSKDPKLVAAVKTFTKSVQNGDITMLLNFDLDEVGDVIPLQGINV